MELRRGVLVGLLGRQVLAGAAGAEELDRLGHHLGAEAAETVATGVVAGAQLAFDVDAPAARAVEGADLGQASEADDRVVLGLLLPVALSDRAPLVAPACEPC